MICTPDFIKVYNETFKFIAENFGKDILEKYFRRIAPIVLADFKKLVEEKGILGCVEYWSNTLTAEKANCHINYDTYTKELFLMMFKCPSLELLGDSAYEGYCDHCAIYKYVLEELGCKFEKKKLGKDGCEITVCCE